MYSQVPDGLLSIRAIEQVFIVAGLTLWYLIISKLPKDKKHSYQEVVI